MEKPNPGAEALAEDSEDPFDKMKITDAKRGQRAQQRLEKYWRRGAAGDVNSASVLEEKSVTAATLDVYHGYVRDFKESCRKDHLRLDTHVQVGSALVTQLSSMYFKGAPEQRGILGGSVAGHSPTVRTRRGLNLPRAKRALKGWKRLAPTRSRIPKAFPFWPRWRANFCVGNNEEWVCGS